MYTAALEWCWGQVSPPSVWRLLGEATKGLVAMRDWWTSISMTVSLTPRLIQGLPMCRHGLGQNSSPQAFPEAVSSFRAGGTSFPHVRFLWQMQKGGTVPDSGALLCTFPRWRPGGTGRPEGEWENLVFCSQRLGRLGKCMSSSGEMRRAAGRRRASSRLRLRAEPHPPWGQGLCTEPPRRRRGAGSAVPRRALPLLPCAARGGSPGSQESPPQTLRT